LAAAAAVRRAPPPRSRRAALARGAAQVGGGGGGADAQMSAMARVWAHPEDAHLYPDAGGAARRRSRGRRTVRLPGDAPPGGGGGPDGGAGFRPGPGLGSEPGHGAWLPALPLVPLLRVAGLQAEAAQRVSSLPAAPGSLTAGLALAASGAMAWVSPLQARTNAPRPLVPCFAPAARPGGCVAGRARCVAGRARCAAASGAGRPAAVGVRPCRAPKCCPRHALLSHARWPSTHV